MRELSVVELELIVGGYDQGGGSYDYGGYSFEEATDGSYAADNGYTFTDAGGGAYSGEVSQADYDANYSMALNDGWTIGGEITGGSSGWGVKITVSKSS